MRRWRARLRLLPLAVRTVVLFTRVEVGLRRSDLPALAGRLGVVLAGPGDSPDPTAAPATVSGRSARQALTVVTRVSERWPAGDTCLRRCLVLGVLLAPVRPVLTLGVRRAEDGTIAAHSWLVVGGRSLDPMAERYGILTW
jgi:hypothetical protein